MVNQTLATSTLALGSQEVYATMLCSLCVFFNSFVALLLWKLDILHLILIELICLNIGTLLGVVVLELIPEVYLFVARGTLDGINVSIVFCIGWGLPLTIEKLLKRGKGNKYKRLMQTTGLDGQQTGGMPKSLRTIVKEKLALKEQKEKDRIAKRAAKAATAGSADAEESRSNNTAAGEEGKDGQEIEMEAPAFNIAIHDDAGESETLQIGADETTVTKSEGVKKPPALSISSSSDDLNSNSGSPASSDLRNFSADKVLTPRTLEMEETLEADEDEAEELARKVASGEDVTLIIIMLMGDMIHNFVDGGVLATAFHVNNSVGIATFIGIFLEEIPHLTSTFAVFVQAGAPIWKSMALNAFGATPFLLGAGIILGVLSDPSNNQNNVNYLIPFASGSFLYVSLADLVPIISMFWHGWIRAAAHLLSVGTGILIQSGIRVYGNSAGATS